MIVQDCCTILYNPAMDAAGTKEEAHMDSTNHWPSEREVQRAQASREELVERLTRAIRDDGTAEPLPGLRLRRASAPTGLGHGVSFPSFCVIAQGSKELLLGDSRYRYDPAQYLIATAALPIASRVVEASPERPYLGIVLKLDSTLVGSVMVEAGHRAPRNADRRDGDRREPAGRGPAGRGGAAGPAAGLPGRSALPRAAGHAGDRLPAHAGSAGRPARIRSRPWVASPTASPRRSSGCGTTSTSRCASRSSRKRVGDERLRLPPPLSRRSRR